MFAQKLLKIVLFVMMGSGAFSFLAWIGLLAASRKIRDSGVIDERRLKEATRAAFPGIVSSGLLGCWDTSFLEMACSDLQDPR